jgi:hypothetical protein
LPEHLFVFFNASDLCHWNLDFAPAAEQYRDEMDKALIYLSRNMPEDHSFKVYIVSPLSFLQIRQSKDILAKQIHADGKTMTCRELQRYSGTPVKIDADVDPRLYMLSQLFPASPKVYCPGIFNEGENGNVAGLLTGYQREVAQLIARKGNSYPRLKVYHIDRTRPIYLEPTDIAQDCFHLSWQGQNKLAREVAADLKGRAIFP